MPENHSTDLPATMYKYQTPSARAAAFAPCEKLAMKRMIAAVAACAFAGLMTITTASAQETKDQPAQPATESQPVPAPEQITLQYVKMSTSKGDIVLALNETKAPISTKNFLQYVDTKHYDGTIFHRVIGSFMIQGGGFDANFNEKPAKDPIKNEYTNGLKNKRGTIAMARTLDPDSAKAQFYINVVDNPGLDTPRRETGNAGYAVFGEVVVGMNVVDEIRNVKTTAKGPFRSDVPADTVSINTVTRLTTDEAKTLIDAAAKPAAPAAPAAPATDSGDKK
jgi:peptidyl-prolyl cis-trans isomerase A (cyclophilin A)